MKNQPASGLRKNWVGAGILLTLALFSCTETKTKSLPAPVVVPPAVPVTNEEAKDLDQYNSLVWSDEFDGSTLDQTKWGYDLGGGGWGNNELETYTSSTDNVYLSGGNLVIKAVQSSGGNAYTSGRILTKGKQSFQYGRLDVRAKLPKGRGIWPAIWMLGADIDQNNWPKCGEIDIMELRGSNPQEFLTTMHYSNSGGAHDYKGITKPVPVSLADDFHTYTVVRSKSSLRFYLDGQSYYSFTGSEATPYPFNNPFFLVLNLAVGGDFDKNPDSTTVFPQQMQVDYVKFFQYK